MENLAAAAQLISAVATIGIALLTLGYLLATRSMVAEMRAARETSDQPRIVVYPVMTNGTRIDVIIENVGRSPAADVSVIAAERDSQDAPVAGMAWPEVRSRQLVGPGVYLPAGASVRRVAMQGRPLEARAESGFSIVQVTSTWEWPEAGRTFSAVSPVDPSILLDRQRVPLPPIRLPKQSPVDGG